VSSRIKTILGLITATAISGFLFFWFGMFNVAATDKHWAITTAFLEWVRERSISSNIEDLKVPNLTDEKLIASGAPNYAAMCEQCHLSPGMATSEFYEGLNPQPPVFHKGETHDRNPVAAFWIISNGIKMTGMASWGSSHTKDQIWAMISFINVMPGMTAEAYKKLVGDGEHSHSGGGDDHDEGTKKPALISIGHHGAAATKANPAAEQNKDQHATKGQPQPGAIQQAPTPTIGSAEQSPHGHNDAKPAPVQVQQQAPVTSAAEQSPHGHGGAKPAALQQPTAAKTSSTEQSAHSHGGTSGSSTAQQSSPQDTHSSESSLDNNSDQSQHSHNTGYDNNRYSQDQYDNSHSNQYQNDSDHSHQQYYYDNYGHSNTNY